MGKIKSAIITAIIAAAILVLAFFALFSWPVAGTGKVDKYNSFASGIHLGADITGEAYTVLYPEGVLSASDYHFNMPEPDTDDGADKVDEYIAKYSQCGSVYIEKDKLEEHGGEAGFKAKVKKDAEILSKRFGQKGYTSYSVSVVDGFTVKVSVPSNMTYAAYSDPEYNSAARSAERSAVAQTVKFLSYNGGLTLRNSEVGKIHDSELDNYILTPIKDNVNTYFKVISKYAKGGNYAVKVKLTDTGRARFKDISSKVSAASSDKNIGFYIGNSQLLSLECNSEIDGKSFFISVSNTSDDSAAAQEYAIILDSVINGDTLTLNYLSGGDPEVYFSTPHLGKNAPIYLGVIILLVIVAAIVYSVVKYKLLGLVNAMMIVIYSLAMVTAIMLIGIQVTVAGAFAAVLGLALLCASNFVLFESVRKETKKGKTIYSSVKSGYKNVLTTILDMHIILVVVSLMLALICVGEIAKCGFIFFIASIASYILYWFTRFMWYVISSFAKDKFKFCGFTREVPVDD